MVKHLKRPLVVTILLSVFLAVFLKVDISIAAGDFASYIIPGKAFLEGKYNTVYNLDFQRQIQDEHLYTKYGFSNYFLRPFLYPPVVGIGLLPLASLDIIAGYKLMLVVMAIVFVLYIKLAISWFKNSFDTTILVALVFLYPPVLRAIVAPQLSPLILLIAIFIYRLLILGKYNKAGIISGLLIIKPQYILMIPFFVILSGNRSNYLKYSLLSLIVLVFINLLLVGVGGALDYMNLIRATDYSEYGNGFASMYSITPALMNLGILNSAQKNYSFLVNGVLYTAALIIFSMKQDKLNKQICFASAAVLTLSLAYHVQLHDLSLLLIPLFILLSEIHLRRNKFKLISILLFLYLMPFGYNFDRTLVSIIMFIVGFVILDLPNFDHPPAGRKLNNVKVKRLF